MYIVYQNSSQQVVIRSTVGTFDEHHHFKGLNDRHEDIDEMEEHNFHEKDDMSNSDGGPVISNMGHSMKKNKVIMM